MGATVDVRWSAVCRGAEGESESELVLSLDGGVTFPIRLTPEMSPCATGFQWRVPALRTAHGRLALRRGSGEESEDERLDLVSEEFAIVAPDAEPPEDLTRGPREWWTRQALDGDGAQQLPAASMAGDAEELVAPGATVEATEPPAPVLTSPAAAAAALSEGAREGRPPSTHSIASKSVAPLPLRL